MKTMNRTGRAKGFSRGIAEIQLSLTVVIPPLATSTGRLLKGRRLPSTHSVIQENARPTDCFTLTVGKTYSVDNEARRDITMQALREVTE